MDNKILGWSIAIVAIAIVIVLIAVFSGTKGEETIKIGVVAPMSGALGMYGNSSAAALEYAAEKMGNEIDGKKIEFIPEDGKCDAAEASKVFNKLVNVDGVKYIMGGFCSGETLTGAPVVEAAKVILISPASSSPDVRSAGEYVFTLYPLDDFGSNFSADFIYNTLGVRKVAIIYGLNDYTKGMKDYFTKSFEALGGKVVIAESNEANATDFKVQLTKVAATDAELLFIADYPAELGNVLTQTSTMGLNITLYVQEQLTPAFVADHKDLVEGVYGSRVVTVLEDSNFETVIKAKSGLTEIDALYSSIAYDGLFMLKQAIEKVGNDPEKVKDALVGMEYSGISGTIKLDKDGVPEKANFKIEKVVNGELVEQK